MPRVAHVMVDAARERRGSTASHRAFLGSSLVATTGYDGRLDSSKEEKPARKPFFALLLVPFPL